MEGGLTLDSRDGWSTGGEHGPAIVIGRPEESLLIKAVRYQNEQLQMPPEEKLSDAKIELLVQWIEHGAVDPRKTANVSKFVDGPMNWWSLRPLIRPPVPRLAASTEAQPNPIDGFVRRKLAANTLTFSPPADRRTLIRRLFFDLHGLPPSPEAVAAFVANPNPRAYEELVDRLLDSPRYGERWARHWLDTVHFADSHGCEHDVFRDNAWRYRDYVIDSFNRDTPWPRFIREQLAADYFYPNETYLTPALGFVSAGPLELSRAGTAPITFDYLDRDDMVTQTMAAFASTTANCARCHDHKFDPITQEDYYSLQAVFAGAGKGDIEFDEDPVVAKSRRHWTELLESIQTADRSLGEKLLSAEYSEIVAQWEKKQEEQPAVWETLLPKESTSFGGAMLTIQQDQSILASDVRPDQDTYTITVKTTLTRLTAIRLDVLADNGLPLNGPGRQDNGNLHLTEFEAMLIDRDGSEEAEPTRLNIRQATADWNQDGWTIAHAIDGDLKTAWGIYPKVGESHFAVFELDEPKTLNPSHRIVIVLKQLHGSGHLIGRLKLFATDTDGATSVNLLPEPVLSAINVQRDQRSEDQKMAIATHALQAYAEKQLAGLPAQSSVYGVSARYSHASKLEKPIAPKVVHVLRRGDIHQPGDVASPGALSVISHPSGRFIVDDANDEPSRRAALADWLADPDNPLTWRSAVNRVWSYHFGRGLCDTPNDFGRMGGTPSHPELLDWLAVWFRDDARGSLKRLHRLIVMSETYQQTSIFPPISSAAALPVNSPMNEFNDCDPSSVDAENRLLWRMNRGKVDAESFRDAVLQISGRIDLTMGGPGIQQFSQSKGPQATPKLDYDAFDWSGLTGARRSIYRVVWRGIADPLMESLDFPDLGQLSPKRGSSESALQALSVFNNDFVLHHSQVLANRLETSHPTLEEQLALACRLVYLREPKQAEHQWLVAFAKQYGLAATCRILLNSNEFVFVD